jgi:hypothetical protein
MVVVQTDLAQELRQAPLDPVAEHLPGAAKSFSMVRRGLVTFCNSK